MAVHNPSVSSESMVPNVKTRTCIGHAGALQILKVSGYPTAQVPDTFQSKVLPQ